MIKRILINKSPVFSYLELDLNPGFNVISGVSGSGKSIFFNSILGAFGLKESNAELVEVLLDINFSEFNLALEDIGISTLESSSEAVVSILKKQSLRYFLNHQSISKKNIFELSQNFLKYISTKGSIELDSEYMINVLDSIISKDNIDFKILKNDFKNEFRDFKILKKELEILTNEQKNIDNLREFAEFEIEKIQRINPVIGEYERLMMDKKLLSKKEKITQIASSALNEIDNLENISKLFDMLEIDIAFFNDALFELRDKIESSLDKFDSINFDPEALLERISVLSDLNRRYGSEEDALKHLKIQKDNLEKYKNTENNKSHIQKQLDISSQKLEALNLKITKNRKKYINIFESRLNHFASQLHLKDIKLNLFSAELGELGGDLLDISLNNISKNLISSGEYNRLRLSMLCISAEIANKYQGILILDEIDANLSGEESEGVARLLKFLSKNYQIFAISHQPFMPILCDYHYLVSKKDNVGSITLLDFDLRVKEIARMIGGGSIDSKTIEYARAKLEEGMQLGI